MRIGLDIDNVVSAFDEAILREFLILDKTKRNAGIINKKARHIVNDMFDWSYQEKEEFFAENMERIAHTLRTRKDARKYMQKLREDGHEIILISNRIFPDYKNPEKTTLDWLKKRKIPYDRLVLSQSPDKTPECKKYNIDIMVDDREDKCKEMKLNGVNCILMLTKYNRSQKEGLLFASSWAKLYEEIKKYDLYK